MQTTKYQHYIPARHLKNFSSMSLIDSSARSEYFRVIVTDNLRGVQYQAPVTRVGGEKYLYEALSSHKNELETLLNYKVDHQIGEVFHSMTKHGAVEWSPKHKEAVLRYMHTLPYRNKDRIKTITREELLSAIHSPHNADDYVVEILDSPFELKLSLNEPVSHVNNSMILPFGSHSFIHVKPVGVITNMSALLDALQNRQQEETHVWVSRIPTVETTIEETS